jgi:hypothetical protein
MVREADQYFADALERLATAVLFTKPEERSPERIARACEDIRRELALWETALTGDWLAGPLSAVDFTLYPELALVLRMASRNPGLIAGDLMGDKVAAWTRRMEALPIAETCGGVQGDGEEARMQREGHLLDTGAVRHRDHHGSPRRDHGDCAGVEHRRSGKCPNRNATGFLRERNEQNY